MSSLMSRVVFSVVVFVLACAACDSDVPWPVAGGSAGNSSADGGTGLGGAAPQSSDKVDLLLVVDNSRTMADKQAILELAVPDLVQQLVNPPCYDASGKLATQQPTDPLQACPIADSKRRFTPVLDIHIGVLSSSIGGHGSDACGATLLPSENDRGRLLSRSSTDSDMTAVVPTWENKGFLVWDPAPDNPSHNPPGETNVDNLLDNLRTMVGGVGEVGCGFEAPLEAWYRFLIDPNPYQSIAIEDDVAVLEGTDEVLLQQRRDFLRPDSLVAVVMLTDENDCSIRDGGQFFWATQIYQPGTNYPYRMPKARAACATDPASDCCRSCTQPPGPGCNTNKDDCAEPFAPLDDSINLRCFDQKRRFGIDFLWPLQRYIDGIGSDQVQDRNGNIVPNPLFSDLQPEDTNSRVRDAGLVFVTAIVGVPWQDVARRTADGKPDLLAGLDGNSAPRGGFMSAGELSANGVWDLILGTPSCYHTDPSACLPTDPLMIESIEPRSGTNPVTGYSIAPPDGGELENPINGHEQSLPWKNNLQHSCIFPLAVPRDCSDNSNEACDCAYFVENNPLCDPLVKTTQKYAKAYPSIRLLQLVEGLGNQGVLASICPQQQNDPTQPTFGYRPAMHALIEAIGPRL